MADDKFKTDNVYLAAFFQCKLMQRTGYTIDGNGRYTFEFADPEACERLREEFELTEVKISIPDFIMHINRLRDIMFGSRRRQLK